MIISLLVLTIMLTVLSAMRPVQSELSLFELDHRSKSGDREAKRLLARDKLLNDIISLQRLLVALLLVIVTVLSVSGLGWVIGVLAAVVIAFAYSPIAQISFMKKLARKLYRHLEGPMLNLISKAPLFFKFIRVACDERSYKLGSSAELRHLVEVSDNVLTLDDKKLIVNGLSFSKQLVGEIMTGRDEIASIDKTEFLGPLALNDLHKVGHSRLPVVDGDIDHIVGILNIKNMLTLDVRKSMTAEKAMESKVNYIRADQTLSSALAALLHTHHDLFVVINEARETVGLLTLNDVLGALLGRKIVDDYDTHDNLHAVAGRKKA